MFRRITTFFFLFIFLYNFVGYYFIFKIEQYQIKEFIKAEIKSNIPEEELIPLSFDPLSAEFKKIVWLDDYEFSYKEHMFDIVKQSTDSNGVLHYLCIKDLQEEQLFAHLEEYIDDECGRKKSIKSFKKDSKD